MKTSEKVMCVGSVMFGIGMLACCTAAAAFSGFLNIPTFISGPNLIGPDKFLPSTLGFAIYCGGIITWLAGGYLALLLGAYLQNKEEGLQH